MTLVVKLDLGIIKMYVCTKNEVPTFSSSKVIIWTDRQTDRLNWNYYLPHMNADGNKMISKTRMYSSRMCTAYSLLYGGSPWQRPPLTGTPLNIDLPWTETPWTETPWTDTPGQRPPRTDKQIPVKTLPSQTSFAGGNNIHWCNVTITFKQYQC